MAAIPPHVGELFQAIARKNYKEVKGLLGRKANVNGKQHGLAPLAKCHDAKITRLLIRSGASLETKDSDGNTALGHASRNELDVAEVLIEYGANVNTKNKSGQTLLNIAASYARSDIMALLLRHEANKWARCSKGTAFFVRLFENYSALLKHDTRHKNKILDRKTFAANEKDIEEARKAEKEKKRTSAAMAIRRVLARDRTMLIHMLSRAAIIYSNKTTIGTNVSWFIGNGVSSARDEITGQKFYKHQIIIPEPVEVTLEDRHGDKVWKIKVSGTTRKVFTAIYLEYALILEEMGDGLFFEGLEYSKRWGMHFRQMNLVLGS